MSLFFYLIPFGFLFFLHTDCCGRCERDEDVGVGEKKKKRKNKKSSIDDRSMYRFQEILGDNVIIERPGFR
jgi:hypothetical protein